MLPALLEDTADRRWYPFRHPCWMVQGHVVGIQDWRDGLLLSTRSNYDDDDCTPWSLHLAAKFSMITSNGPSATHRAWLWECYGPTAEYRLPTSQTNCIQFVIDLLQDFIITGCRISVVHWTYFKNVTSSPSAAQNCHIRTFLKNSKRSIVTQS